MYEIERLPQSIDIGYTGEMDFRTVQIDMSEWVAKMPEGQPTLMHIRPGEYDPYPVTITYENNIITWSVTDGDLGTSEGTGLLQVWFGVQDETEVMRQLGMSAVVPTIIHLSLAGEGRNSSTVQIPWLKEVMELKNIILGYDYEAESWANGKRGGEDVGSDDPAYHNNAKYYKEQVESMALDSEAFAAGTRGGEAVDEDDPAYHNNASYYNDQAALEKAAAQAAAETASAAYNVNLLAANYDATKTYAVGEYVIYSGGLYRCISAITTAEAWTAAHWSSVTVGKDTSALKSAIVKNNSYDVITDATHESWEHNGVTWTWNADKTVCTASGRATSRSRSRFFVSETSLPGWITPGKTYYIRIQTTGTAPALYIAYYKNGTLEYEKNYKADAVIAIPSDITGFMATLQVASGNSVDGTIAVQMMTAKTNEELHQEIIQNEAQKIKEIKYNSYNILDYVGSFVSGSLYDVDFTWNQSHTECTANGTANGSRAYTNIYNNSTSLPSGVVAGEKYNVSYNTTDAKFGLVIGLYDTEGVFVEEKTFSKNGVIEVPVDCGGMYIRLYVNSGNTVTNAKATNIALFNAKSNEELTRDVNNMGGTLTGYDILTKYGVFEDREFRGITFDWTGRKCHVSGTADGGEAYCNIFYGTLPDGMLPGELYRIRYASTSSRIGVKWYFYDSTGTSIDTGAGSLDMEIVVPENASMWLLRIYVLNGITLDAYLTRLQVVKMRRKEMDVPLIVSFVDDDTSTDNFVTKFHDACCHNGVKGNYAVITKHIEDGNTNAAKLLSYEDDGFGTLIHCYQQAYVPSSDSPWTSTLGVVRTEVQTNACRANLAKGLRQMREAGFVNFDMWITPGGHMEPDLISISKQLGLKCLISTNNGRENNMTDYDKQFIKRVSFSDNDSTASSSMTGIKTLIDEVADRGKGWLIITTHFNEGWSSQTWDDTLDENGYPVGYSRFNEMVQYALSKGLTPMSMPEAWEYYAPILEANRDECNSAN